MVLVGGLGTFEGPILGAIILFVIQNETGDNGVWYFVFLGAVAIGFALLLPRGIWGTVVDRFGLRLLPVGYRLREPGTTRRGASMTSVAGEIKLQHRSAAMGRRRGRSTFDDLDPFTGEVVARAPRRTRADAGARRGGGGGLPGVVADAAGGAAADLPEGGRPARGAARRGRVVLARETGCGVRLRDVPAPLRARALPPGGGARVRAARRGDPVRHGRVRDGAAAARRRRRRDRAVERGADPLRALDRGAARARQHGRAEAVRALALLGRPALGRDLRGGGPAGRRAERRHARAGRGRRDRRRARREPARAAAQLHRLDRDGRPARRGLRAGSSSASCSSSAAPTR